jgi:streptogrisin C
MAGEEWDMQRPLRIVALLAVLTLAVLAGQPQAAGAPPTMAPTPYLADASDRAVTTLAKDRNISIQEAQRRIGWQDPAVELGEELRRALGDRFGGLWIDPADGGRVKVGIRGSATADARTLIARRQLTAVTDLVPVRHSYADLEAANKRLGEAAAHANRGTSRGIQTGLRVNRNAVHLHLQLPRGHRLTAAQQAVVDTAKQHYGSSLVISYTDRPTRPYACAWVDFTDPTGRFFTCDAPLRAGVFTTHTRAGTDGFCTTAFYAQSKVNTEKYIMFAGHCRDYGGGGTWYVYQPSTGIRHAVGLVHNSVFDSTGDFAIVHIDNVAGWNPKHWVYVHASADTALDPDYYIIDDAGSAPGIRVCLSGARTGTHCGDVDDVGVRDQNFPYTDELAQVDLCAGPGDSGGPIYSNHTARGILHGGPEGGACFNILYQGVQEAERRLNVNIIHGG